MSSQHGPPFIQRASIDGALCTVRCMIGEGEIPGTKGEWLGIEWDDPRRGKHDGTLRGKRYFSCQSTQSTVASFIRKARKFDTERTVLEAIKSKYGGDSVSSVEAVVISGKVAEEIGFDKIAKEQAVFEDLKILVLEHLEVIGIASRASSPEHIKAAQLELAETCPNVVDLDLSYNVIETWSDVYDICVAFPKLRVLRLNGLRLQPSSSDVPQPDGKVFRQLKELQLNETLLKPQDVIHILGPPTDMRFPNLRKLWLSQNELERFYLPESNRHYQYQQIEELVFENNLFTTIDCLQSIVAIFPSLRSISFQRNQIKTISQNTTAQNGTMSLPNLALLEAVSVSHNQISSFDFVDTLSAMLPNLTALRMSGNPIYDTPQSDLPTTNPSETNYYLTLARVPSLKILNYSQITHREREEGEIYYLAIAERDIKSIVSAANIAETSARTATLKMIETKYPRYQPLCTKYDRESLITKIFDSSDTSAIHMLQGETKPKHPAGSIAAQLIQATFYTTTHDSSHSSPPPNSGDTIEWAIPASIPTSQVFAFVARSFKLPPLQFKMIYESEEFDPVRDHLTTKSQLYTNDKRSAAERYQAWGDWDADRLVESSLADQVDKNVEKGHHAHAGQGVDIHAVSDGTKWRRREIEILMGLRSWGDWLDAGVDRARVRIDPI